MTEPEIALVFTPEAWVEELHRHLTDHGGARVRQVVVEPGIALEERYDVLVASGRWPALTSAFVEDLHQRGRSVLGVHDREEPGGRAHLTAVGVDSVLAADCGPKAFVDAIRTIARLHTGAPPDHRFDDAATREPVAVRSGRIIVVGGPPGTGRTEIALHLAAAVGDVLVDADEVGPTVATRLSLAIEPNIRTAIDAAEHGATDRAGASVDDALVGGALPGVAVLPGLPNPGAWTHVRAGEVLRVVTALATPDRVVVVDGAGELEEVGGPPRGRHAVARALIVDADIVVGVCNPTPAGIVRFLAWAVEVRTLAPATPMVAVVNRAPADRFRRGELYDEIVRSVPVLDVVFVADDRRVNDAAWDGRLSATGPFVRAVRRLAEAVCA